MWNDKLARIINTMFYKRPISSFKKEDVAICDLRDVQSEISVTKQQIKDLKTCNFPMVSRWAIIWNQSASPWFLQSGCLGHGDIEDTIIKRAMHTLSKEEHNNKNLLYFDVEQFCNEFKEMFDRNNKIAQLNKRLETLRKTESDLKNALGIL